MVAIASYHSALAARSPTASLDDRTWRDLDLDQIFAAIDRTGSSIGQQSLYHRLRSTNSVATIGAFESLVSRASTDVERRERCQLALAPLRHPAGYEMWRLAERGALNWTARQLTSPALALAVIVTAALGLSWPPAFLGFVALLPACIAVRVVNGRQVAAIIEPFRLLGPLIAAAAILRCVAGADTNDVTAPLGEDAPLLTRLGFVAGWLTRDAVTMDPISGTIVELLNFLLALDGNALLVGALELKHHSPALKRTLSAVGEVDAAIAIAAYRANTQDWTRPSFQPPDSAFTIRDLGHPLLPSGIRNSVTFAPPHYVLITGSNMSGKSTFLRSLGVAAVMSQTVHTCAAAAYECPVLRVRSCMGRSDNLVEGRSYYLDEVEGIVGLVHAAVSDDAHLFLLDELFRGTNAVERIAAGEATLAELSNAKTRHLVVVATHDLVLDSLLSPTYTTFHFANHVSGEQLIFDYRLTSGPATTRNAISLLELNGAPPGMVDRARALAERLQNHRQT
jgi:hypothetical protein